LKNIGINEIALKLIKSYYFFSRSEYVKIKYTPSSKELIKCIIEYCTSYYYGWFLEQSISKNTKIYTINTILDVRKQFIFKHRQNIYFTTLLKQQRLSQYKWPHSAYK